MQGLNVILETPIYIMEYHEGMKKVGIIDSTFLLNTFDNVI
jgi:hypothetical protein